MFDRVSKDWASLPNFQRTRGVLRITSPSPPSLSISKASDRYSRAPGLAATARDSAKTSKEGAARAVRNAWSHILFPVKTDATKAGKAFELEHLALSAKDKGAIPAGVYEKARADGVVLEKLGPDTLWLKLRPLWAEDRPYISISEIADWFASYVYLPKVRDRVVLETSIRDAIGKFDAVFGYAERFDAEKAAYEGLIYAKTAPLYLSPHGLLVRADVAQQTSITTSTIQTGDTGGGPATPTTTSSGATILTPSAQTPAKPHRFYGSVEIDMSRPVKAFDTILNSVVMELQRSRGAKVKLILEIEAEAPSGFNDADVGVVRDNTKQLKFTPGSTGFSD
jgi:hypothetical protein